jgi:hypothetical protein
LQIGRNNTSGQLDKLTAEVHFLKSGNMEPKIERRKPADRTVLKEADILADHHALQGRKPNTLPSARALAWLAKYMKIRLIIAASKQFPCEFEKISNQELSRMIARMG